MAKIFGLTEQNRQPEPPTRKPNEDFFDYFEKKSVFFAAVMDGIPVLRDEHGVYPGENGSVASQLALKTMTAVFANKDPNEERFRNAFRNANSSIWLENEKLGMYAKTPPYWLATVGCALWGDTENGNAFFGYIGDPLAFTVSPDHNVKLLTEDQLAPFESHLWTRHKEEMGSTKDSAANVSIREYQDRHVRNRFDAACFCGEPIRGWGALTGEASAMDFVVITVIATPPGTRVILASDAVEAIGAGNAKERRAEDYRGALLSTISMSPEDAARELLRLTRAGETEKRCKSDDATFVVIDF